MVGVFDTAFFHALPDHVRAYALPSPWAAGPQSIRRYGFHGLAHRYMAERYSATYAAGKPSTRIITLQLGHGCSIAAIRNGQAIETSMGFTPLEGLIMATRPGDVDAGVLLHLLLHRGVTPEELNAGLNHRAGLLGLSGVTSDMRELLALEAEGHAGARLAVAAFCHRARKYVGACLAVLGGADAVVFGGGIGEHAATVRARICAGLDWAGLQLDEESNRSTCGEEARISTPDATIASYVIPVDEEALIARDTVSGLGAAHNQAGHPCN
jgi:acetate kinase